MCSGRAIQRVFEWITYLSVGYLTLRFLRTWWVCFLETYGNRSYSDTPKRSTLVQFHQKAGVVIPGVVLLTVCWMPRETGGLGEVYKVVDDSKLSDESDEMTC